MDIQQLMACTGANETRATNFADIISGAMDEFEINTTNRQAAFLAQIGHESGGLHYTTEIWGPTPAQSRYEGRADLGNTEPGDGVKYKGRGLIQTTGRNNYQLTGDALGVDLIGNPTLLAEPELAARSAAWFWKEHGLNELADAGKFETITRRINGGVNGLNERLKLYESAKLALG
jgi:putative chitinase